MRALKVHCDYCNACSINGHASHETGCSGVFLFTDGRGRIFETYTVWSLDAWGNRRDGFEVNDRSRRGTVLLPQGFSDKQLLKTLKSKGWLNKRSQFRSFDIDGDDMTVGVNWMRTSEPLFQLERC